MNAELLAGLAGVLVSLVFEYVPGVSQWLDAKPAQYKKLFMLGAMAVVGAGSFGLSCFSPYQLGIDCDTNGAWGVLATVGAAVVANQGFHRITKKD